MRENDYYADSNMVDQIENIAKLPFAFHHVALSPDGHVGYGMPIGGILATKDLVKILVELTPLGVIKA